MKVELTKVLLYVICKLAPNRSEKTVRLFLRQNPVSIYFTELIEKHLTEEDLKEFKERWHKAAKKANIQPQKKGTTFKVN